MEAMGIQALTLCRRPIFLCAVVASGFLHLMAIWAWRDALQTGRAGEQRDLAPFEVLLLKSPALPASESSHTRLSSQSAQVQPGLPSKSINRNPQDSNPGRETAVDIDTPAASVLGADQMIEAAKRNIGKIDRELRQAFPSRSGLGAAAPASSLEKSISSAGLPRGTVMQEIVSENGRRLTKVITASSTYCVLGRKPGAGIAENELAALIVVTCPN
jgi:hypothetical protein